MGSKGCDRRSFMKGVAILGAVPLISGGSMARQSRPIGTAVRSGSQEIFGTHGCSSFGHGIGRIPLGLGRN